MHPSHSNTSAYHSHYKMQHDHEGEYDEDRGGPRNANNYLSFTSAGVIFKATKGVWHWETPGAHEADQRMLVPSAYVEGLFAHAPVPEPGELQPERFLEKCLSWPAYISSALTKLISEGLFTHMEDGEEVEHVFEDIDELYAKARTRS